MENQDCICLGKILKPFSYNGELKIYIEDFYIDQVKELDSFLLKIQGSYIPFTIKAITKNKSNIFRISLDGIDSEDLAKKFNLLFIPFLLQDVALNPKLNLSDGIHPNEKGVKIISNTISKKLISVLKN